MKKILSASLLAAGLALAGSAQAATTLLNVSYDVMRDFYKDYNAAFQKHWAAEHPDDKLTLQMSFGGSSKQARSVIDGLPADVITMNMATDINALVDNGKLVPDNWVTRLPNNSAPFTSATVFIVRKGNPKALKDWPDLLKDHRRLAADGWHKLWLEFSAGRRMDANPPEHPAVPGKVAFDAKKLREQAVMGGVCALLALGAAWVLLRTLRRTIEADAGGLTAADGRRIEFRQFDRLDKRKWKSKGLAYAWFDAGGSRRRIRIDGLTYGGFRKEDGEPAERLMQRLEANFSGELIDYAE